MLFRSGSSTASFGGNGGKGGFGSGGGIDHKSYAMAYGKEGPKPAIACGIVLEGKTPINIMMEL